MSLFARFDLHTLAPPEVGDALPPEELLAWCRNSGQAWRETTASGAELDALMRELDGDRALQALPSAAARLRVRLGLKAREALGWRRAGDPWDAGRLRELDALLRFEPRRPTLIVASHGQAAARELIAARQPAWSHAVRLLISAAPSPPGT
jgi:hypothetical protein